MATNKKESTAKNWKTLDINSLPAVQKQAYETYKEADRKARALRDVFEGMVNKDAEKLLKPLNKKFIFAYQYGVGIAIADLEPAKTNSKAVSLADYLAVNAA